MTPSAQSIVRYVQELPLPEGYRHGHGLAAEIAGALVLGLIHPEGIPEAVQHFRAVWRDDTDADAIVDGLAHYLRLRDGDILRVAALLDAGGKLARIPTNPKEGN